MALRLGARRPRHPGRMDRSAARAFAERRCRPAGAILRDHAADLRSGARRLADSVERSGQAVLFLDDWPQRRERYRADRRGHRRQPHPLELPEHYARLLPVAGRGFERPGSHLAETGGIHRKTEHQIGISKPKNSYKPPASLNATMLEIGSVSVSRS